MNLRQAPVDIRYHEAKESRKHIVKRKYSSDSESLSDFSLHDDTSDNISSEDDFLYTPDFENINVETLKEHQKKKSFNAKNTLPSSSFDSDDEMPLITLKRRGNIASGSSPRDSRRLNNSFTTSGLVITPEMKIPITKRKPALNSKAQKVTKDLFAQSNKRKQIRNKFRPVLSSIARLKM
nr:unnamed protein product [Callosobruchus chinensis]